MRNIFVWAKLFFVLCIVLCAGIASADDICTFAAQAKGLTSVQFGDFAEKRAVMRRFDGTARVRDVWKGGDTIHFSGMVTGVYQERYVDNHKEYICVSFNDDTQVW